MIINTGYLPPKSPLLMAKEGVIAHNGTSIDVHADVSQIELSGHGDQEDLTNFVATLKPKQTFLVHGDVYNCGALMAGCLIASLPIVIVYNFFVERFISGLTLGAVKG